MRHSLRILLIVLLSAVGFTPDQVRAQTGPAGQKVENQAPDSYVLTAAYPNPFNPSTTFSLTVRQRQNVKVQVFNMLGQPVKQLYTGMMNAGETRTFTFEASELPSGIYIYRVQGETFIAARQMTLVK